MQTCDLYQFKINFRKWYFLRIERDCLDRGSIHRKATTSRYGKMCMITQASRGIQNNSIFSSGTRPRTTYELLKNEAKSSTSWDCQKDVQKPEEKRKDQTLNRAVLTCPLFTKAWCVLGFAVGAGGHQTVRVAANIFNT